MPKIQQWKWIAGLIVGVAAVVSYVAYRTRRVPTPRRPWFRFRRPGTKPLSDTMCTSLQGIYCITEGNEFFGDTAVVKCSYTVERGRKLFHLSFFCQKNGTYFICEGRQHKASILLYGHWRKAAANGSGLVQLVLKPAQGGMVLFKGETPQNLLLSGRYGNENHRPQKALRLRWEAPLPQGPPFEIIGHRGGARNVDFLNVSENSLDMMKMAAHLGATGVEIDVRLTKDDVPVVFHDSFLSVHTTRGPLYGGLIHQYTLQDLKKIRLRKGGRIPTLDECLHTILHKTPLRTVWLDVKKECRLHAIAGLQQRYNEKAKALGREFCVYIGIPDEALLKCFLQLPDYKAIPSLTELSIDTAIRIGANVWAPQYTGGFQRGNVEKIKASGARAFVWSLDSEFLIDLYVKEGGFDGLVTNTPAVVAHWHYMRQHRINAPAALPLK